MVWRINYRKTWSEFMKMFIKVTPTAKSNRIKTFTAVVFVFLSFGVHGQNSPLFDDPSWQPTNADWLKDRAKKAATCAGTMRAMSEVFQAVGLDQRSAQYRSRASAILIVAHYLLATRSAVLGQEYDQQQVESYLGMLASNRELNMSVDWEVSRARQLCGTGHIAIIRKEESEKSRYPDIWYLEYEQSKIGYKKARREMREWLAPIVLGEN